MLLVARKGDGWTAASPPAKSGKSVAAAGAVSQTWPKTNVYTLCLALEPKP
jgi:hypothetical protein